MASAPNSNGMGVVSHYRFARSMQTLPASFLSELFCLSVYPEIISFSFYYNMGEPESNHGIRLNFSSISNDMIPIGLERLKAPFSEVL